MKVKVKAFPAVYFTVHCRKHECLVEIRPKMSSDRTGTFVMGGQLTAIKCEVGGPAQHCNCVDSWEMAISGNGDVVISN
jgi:hypothetical protein